MHIPPALKHRQFAIFWTGNIFAWIGYQMLNWAIPWQISDFTASPLALGAVGLIRLVPLVLGSLFAGIIADRFNRRKVVFITQGTMGLVALTLAILTISGKIQLWQIYTLLLVQATAFIFDLPSRYSLTPNLVSKETLANALSVEFFGLQAANLIGPLLNGLLIDKLGVQAAFLTAAGAFALMLIALVVMRNVPQQKLASSIAGIDWVAIKEGLSFTLKHPLIFPSLLLDFFATLLTRADSLMPYFAREILGVTATQYGWLTAASAIGAGLAALSLSQVRQIRRQGHLLVGATVMIGIAAVIFGSSRNFYLSVAALILVGASDSVSSIIRATIRQFHTDDRLRGRMTSVNQIFFMGGPYLGDVKSGFLGGLIGVPLAVALGGVACIFTTDWIGKRWPTLRTYEGEASEA
jgi:MFS family permease